ncbi:MAG: LysR substrate-binding domain-containing protein [Pseudomonadota bacterium]
MVVQRRASEVPSTKILAAFEATGRLGSAVRASQELNVSHTTISKHINALESRLQVKLFERHGSGLRLTNSGQRIHQTVSETFDVLVKTMDEETSNSNSNRIVISTTPSLAQGWLMPRLAKYRISNPSVELELWTSRTIEDADDNEMDIILLTGDGSWPIHNLEPLCHDLICPVCSPEFLAKNGGEISLPDMPSSVFINDLDPLLDWSQWLGEGGDQQDSGGMRLHGGELSSEAAKRGMGIALVRHLTVSDDLERGHLVRIGKEQRKIENAVWIGGARNALHKLQVRRFRDWVQREAQNSFTDLAR